MASDVYKKVKQVLWVILFANLGVAILKIIFGTIIKSASMTADGFHSLTDGSSNIVGLIGVRLASKPVDDDHPYGHGKFETLTGLFIAAMLFLISGKIIYNAIDRIINPTMPIIGLESVIALVLTLCINIIVCVYEYGKGKQLNSQILMSDSMHTRSDIYVSVGVLVALLCIKMGLPPVIDPIVSLVVAGFIIHAAYDIYKKNRDVLVDKAVVNTEKIREIALSFMQVKDVHDIRSRGSENNIYIDMHIMTEPDMSVEESHKLIHSIEEKLREEINGNVEITAHLEPFGEENEA